MTSHLMRFACLAAFLAVPTAASAQSRMPQSECVTQVLRHYPDDFSEGVTSLYKFRLDSDRNDLLRFVRGIEAMGASVVPVRIDYVDYYFVAPVRPSRSIQDLFEQVHALCDLLPSRAVTLVEFQHTRTGRSEEPR